ncbi:Imm2 family immunity protein [Pectobacterium aroidearum]|uniref:Imm2 family immunity protein n=1 Tax=Pectobacterium aroidearum TaxID=1201031 RepID=UPI0015DE6E4F|nr:Imm2 family immunity protein [Pectobacterium aroidearum]MBA0206311.1 immunity protein Imm2 [Pectobacterium aroidearum]
MNEERIRYNEIRESFLECYYIYCRHKIHSSNMTGNVWIENGSEGGYAYEQEEGAYDFPIENLMLEVLSLIMIAGRGPEKAEKYHREMIEKILAEHPLEQLLEEIAEEEKSDLLYDMSLLGLIDKKSE